MKKLKPIPSKNKGLSKLPQNVRMKDGGPVRARAEEAMKDLGPPRVRGYK